MQAMCSGGSETPRSAFPSLVQTTNPPVSAIAKLTPVSPASACIGLELFEIVSQPCERVRLDACRRLAQPLPFGDLLRHLVTARANKPERLVVPLGTGAILNKRGGAVGMIHTAYPARISAIW